MTTSTGTLCNAIVPALSQLAGHAPVLLAYLVGMVLALAFWRRCPRPAALTMLATGLMLVVAVAQTFVHWWLLSAGAESWILFALGLVSSLLYAAGLGLLLAAVFLGRRTAPPGPGS